MVPAASGSPSGTVPLTPAATTPATPGTPLSPASSTPASDASPGTPATPPINSGGSAGSGATDRVAVDTDALAAGIPLVQGLMERLAGISNGTASTIAAFNLNRGDSYGETFAAVNNPLTSNILDGLSSAATVFGDTATSSNVMLRNYVNTEEANIETANNLLSPPQG
jgi:hypothetical protein